MQVPRKQHRRRRLSGGSENSCVRHRSEHKDHVWSYDFLSDRTEDGVLVQGVLRSAVFIGNCCGLGS
jgi:hypothetical protein